MTAKERAEKILNSIELRVRQEAYAEGFKAAQVMAAGIAERFIPLMISIKYVVDEIRKMEP